ncbi:hypothetical protein Tco_0605144, partial [Tanacetum coccineum]
RIQNANWPDRAEKEAWAQALPKAVTNVFRRLKQNRPPSPRLRPRKEGCVFNRLGRKEPCVSTRSDSHHQSSQAKRTRGTGKKASS